MFAHEKKKIKTVPIIRILFFKKLWVEIFWCKRTWTWFFGWEKKLTIAHFPTVQGANQQNLSTSQTSRVHTFLVLPVCEASFNSIFVSVNCINAWTPSMSLQFVQWDPKCPQLCLFKTINLFCFTVGKNSWTQKLWVLVEAYSTFFCPHLRNYSSKTTRKWRKYSKLSLKSKSQNLKNI